MVKKHLYKVAILEKLKNPKYAAEYLIAAARVSDLALELAINYIKAAYRIER